MNTLQSSIAFAALVLPFAAAVSLAQSSAEANAITDRYLTTVQTNLNGALDTQKTTVGEQVAVTILQDTQLADYTKLPKGTLLVGRVLQVQAQDEQHVGAVLAINFDHAQLKDGKVVPVRSVIREVAPVKPLAAPDLGMQGSQGGRNGRDTATAASGGPDDGGAGGSGGPALSTGRSRAGIGGGGSNSAGNTGNPNLNSLPSGGAVAEGPVVHAGESLSTAPRATALPGVLLSATATANASGTLIAPGRNISLASGTRITLGVIRR